jgi:hypothetical protein
LPPTGAACPRLLGAGFVAGLVSARRPQR